MSWSQARFGSYLTLNKDRTPRDEPSLWMPPNMKILIPPDGQDHARPFILLEGEDPSRIFTLILHEHAIDGMQNGQRKRLVEI